MTLLEKLEDAREEGRKEGREEGLEESIRNVMKNLHLTEEEAMDALGILASERKKYG